jgi:hypothetical protein
MATDQIDSEGLEFPPIFNSSSLSLTLRPNVGPQVPIPVTRAPSPESIPILPRIKRSKYDILLFGGSLFLSAFTFYYVYETLLTSEPALGKLLFAPSTTVFVINVLSQILGTVLALLFAAAFELLRWQLTTRDNGVQMSTFLAMSGATSLVGIWRLLFGKGMHIIWCLQRYECYYGLN